MRRLASFYLVLILCPALLDAGPIYGSIFYNGAAFSRASITVACGGPAVSGSTLDDGSYRVRVPQEGHCKITVEKGGVQASAEIVSYSSATQYNFVVVRGGGGYQLRRQ